jgi:hypothetical protein
MRKLVAAFFTAVLLAAGAAAQGQTAPTLRVVTEDPTLPSELFYGDVKVKPVRLRPGTNTPITIMDNDFFVQQQYIDFLSRFPEAAGFQAWMNVLNSCNGDRNCLDGPDGKRVQVSQMFYQAPEFNIKGFFAHRYYAATLDRLATYQEFVADMRNLTGQTADETNAKRDAFAANWVNRAEFKAVYDALNNTQFVDTVLQRAEITLPNRQALIDSLGGGASRASVLRQIIESQQLQDKEYDPAFVAIQYFGYLRRAPEKAGYDAWLSYLRSHPGDYKTMVWGFVYSQEYTNRF